MPELITPCPPCHESFLEAMAEFRREGRGDGDDHSMIGRDLREASWDSEAGFAAYLERVVNDREEGAPRPAGHVPCTTLWWVDGTTYLGRIAIRHRLTPPLRELGGHIGYDVRPSRRRAGHATAMLAAAKPYARELGIDPALITCDEDNIASRRVIESAGGVLEDIRGVKRRYWVPMS